MNEIIHTHTTPSATTVEHKHERGDEIHHHGWHRGTDPNVWIAADQGYYYDDVTDEFGEKRRHTPEVLGPPQTFEIPVVLVMTGFDNEYDAAQEACSQMSQIETGSDPVDCWTMPAHLDITGADDRAGTIVYGSDNRLIVKALKALNPKDMTDDEKERVGDLIAYLSDYFFNGA